MLPEPVVAYEHTFDALYGLRVLEVTDQLARGRVEVADSVRQPMGLVHGGVFASMAESLTSMATAMAVSADGRTAQGLSNQTSFLRPILSGTIHAGPGAATGAAPPGSGRSTSPTTTAACARSSA